MTIRRSLTWGARFVVTCAILIAAQLSTSPAFAKEHCPFGTLLSGGTCCEPGSEYVASKNQCMPARPERRCAQGHLDDCVSAARGLERHGKVGEGYAAELYRFACEEGHAPGCRGLAQLYDEGRGVERDGRRAMNLWEDACAQGDAPSCTILAHLFAKQGFADSRVSTLLAMGCHRGDASACSEYAASIPNQSSQKSTVVSYLERACTGGVGSACRSLIATERSDKALSPARERELLALACRAQDTEACTLLGEVSGYSAPRRGEAHRKD